MDLILLWKYYVYQYYRSLDFFFFILRYFYLHRPHKSECWSHVSQKNYIVNLNYFYIKKKEELRYTVAPMRICDLSSIQKDFKLLPVRAANTPAYMKISCLRNYVGKSSGNAAINKTINVIN